MEVSSKRRNWIKNAVIIFLAVLLVLTFFSNTFMNRSLPQVATQYVMSQTITTAVRGTGTVMANSAYEVEFEGDRTIRSVAAKVGSTVNAGDVLFELYEDEEDGTLQQLRDELDDMEYQYRLALLSMTNADYARENRDIADAKADLQEMINERDASVVTPGDISVAVQNVEAAQANVEAAQEKVDKLTEELGEAGGGDSGAAEQLYDLYMDLDEAEKELASDLLTYDQEYEIFEKGMMKWRDTLSDEQRKYYESLPRGNYANYYQFLNGKYDDYYFVLSDAFADYLRKSVDDGITNNAKTKLNESYSEYYNSTKEFNGDYTPYTTAYDTVKAATDRVCELKYQILKAEAQMQPTTPVVNVDKLNEELKAAKEELKANNKALETAQKILDDLREKETNYDTLSEQIKSSERALEDLIFNLSEQKKNDNQSYARDQLELNRQKEAMEKKQAEIDKASNGEVVNAITAPVSGTVTQINISAGNKTSTVPGALCIIEEQGRGYTMSFPITAEQSRKLTVGDVGTVDTGWWWGGNITATLTAITADPQNPQAQKIAHFTVEGDDVNAGDQLTVSINQRSAAYDMVVPTSAVRNDSNGSYVLLLQAKNTPLGDRYYAQRADVEVIASDDTNSAITGAVVAYDYVITSASAPVEPGDMVRLSDK